MQSNPTSPATTGAPQSGESQVVPSPSGPFTAREMYDAAQVHRRVIRDQLNRTENSRDELARELRQPTVGGADRTGLEEQLKAVDARILQLREELAQAEQREAQAAAVPGSTARSPLEVNQNRFETVLAVSTFVTIALALPLVIAYARRIWKKTNITMTMTPELERRMDTIERAVESTAVEVERIGEGQRFVTQLLASRTVQDQAALPKER